MPPSVGRIALKSISGRKAGEAHARSQCPEKHPGTQCPLRGERTCFRLRENSVCCEEQLQDLEEAWVSRLVSLSSLVSLANLSIISFSIRKISSAFDLKSPLERGGPLAVGSVHVSLKLVSNCAPFRKMFLKRGYLCVACQKMVSLEFSFSRSEALDNAFLCRFSR